MFCFLRILRHDFLLFCGRFPRKKSYFRIVILKLQQQDQFIRKYGGQMNYRVARNKFKNSFPKWKKSKSYLSQISGRILRRKTMHSELFSMEGRILVFFLLFRTLRDSFRLYQSYKSRRNRDLASTICPAGQSFIFSEATKYSSLAI